MILALGYWVMGTVRYSQILDSTVIGNIFFTDTQYDTDQSALGTVHMIAILTSAVWLLSADDGREGVKCKLSSDKHTVHVIDGRKAVIYFASDQQIAMHVTHYYQYWYC